MSTAAFHPESELVQIALTALYQHVAVWAEFITAPGSVWTHILATPPTPPPAPAGDDNGDNNQKAGDGDDNNDSNRKAGDGDDSGDSNRKAGDGDDNGDSSRKAGDGDDNNDSNRKADDGDSDELFLHPAVLTYLRAHTITFTATPILALMRAEAHRRWHPALAGRLTPSSVGRVLGRLRLPRLRTKRARRFQLTLPHLARLLAAYPAALPPELAHERLARALQALLRLPPYRSEYG